MSFTVGAGFSEECYSISFGEAVDLFGKKISKAQRLSNWEAETLTESQINYAATDAWACVEIYNCLAEMEQTGNYEVIKVENNNE